MAEKKKILVVEDFDEWRELLMLYIRHLGYEVSGAIDGIHAVEQAAAIHPDLILMDLAMPRMNGQEATVRLKADPATKDIPVIISTAYTRKDHTDSALEAGALAVLLKPLDITALGEVLARCLRQEEKTTIPP